MKANSTLQNDSQKRVALIDDEEIVLQSIKSFLELETDYTILSFQSPLVAIKALKQTPPDLVISDFLMPEMNGIEFLREIKKLFPEIPRILLTAYADKENAIKAINEIGLFQFIEKPWDNNQLMLIIQNGIATKNLKSHLQEKIRELDEINRQKETLFQINNLLQKEISLAKRVHDKMLPPYKMNIDGIHVEIKYIPAFEIGGDFYDLYRLTNGNILLTLADLTGHGIQAALCTALLKFAVSLYNEDNFTLDEILKNVNNVLYKGLPSDIFAAVTLISCDLQKRECKIINGGIPYPIFQKQNGQLSEQIIVSGLVPGMVSNIHFKPGKTVNIYYEKGDRLYLFTDGLSEIQDNDGKLFGEEKLIQIINQTKDISLDKTLDIITQEAFRFKSDHFTLDDLTLICLEFN